MGDNNKKAKNTLTKSSSPKPLDQFLYKAFLREGDFSFSFFFFTYKGLFHSQKGDNNFFSLYQCYDIIKLCANMIIGWNWFLRLAMWPIVMSLLFLLYKGRLNLHD